MAHDSECVACDLSALNPAERTRRAALASAVTARFLEVRETSDGYTARLDCDAALVHDTLEWILLERRCCPFLRLELQWEPSLGPMWLTFGGGAGVKEFLAAAGFTAREG